MKKILILLLVLSFLLQSCYSYKSIEKSTTAIKIGKTYKFTVQDKKYKGKLINFSDSVATLKTFNSQKDFKTEDITKLKLRKFSIVKTALLPVAIVAVISGIFIATYDPDFKFGNLNPI